MINLKNFRSSLSNFKNAKPFEHCVIDNFFTIDYANKIADEFPKFDDQNVWHEYNNPLEIKKTCNNWNIFGKHLYECFCYFNSVEFCSLISEKLNISPIFSDPGLHGGGLHTHKKGGKLNRHLDYHKHPKLNLIRKLNLIIYVSKNWKDEYGGNLGFWNNDQNLRPKDLVKEILPKFNRAVLFDTSQNSWHGLSQKVTSPESITRNSLAIYYLTINDETSDRERAYFVPDESQKNDPEIYKIIEQRSMSKSVKSTYVYRKKNEDSN